MNAALETRAEVLKLARLLGRDPDAFDYLAEVPAEDLRVLREEITEVLFSANDATLTKLAAASRLLPVGLVATIGERAFGSTLSARMAGLLDPERAVEMAGKLPVSFLADVAVNIDPRRTQAVIAGIPPEQVAEITAELARRGDYVMMGRFVGHLPSESLAAAVEVLDDPALLRSAFVLENKETLRELVALMPDERLDSVIDAAAREELWAEALDLLSNVSDEQRADFARRAGTRDDEVLESLVRAARELGLWTSLLPLVADVSSEEQARFAAIVQRLDLTAEERREVIAYAREQGLLGRLGPLAEALEQG